MDWGKAKSILIAALLLTNIFFLFTYMQANKVQKATLEDSNVIEVLAKRGITMDTPIPKWNNELGVLNVEYLEIPEYKIQKMLARKDGFNISKVISRGAGGVYKEDEGLKARYAEDARGVLEYFGVGSQEYVFTDCNISADAGRIAAELVFSARYNNITVDGLYFIFRYENSTLTNIEYKWFKTMREGNKNDVLPPEAALMRFMGDFKGDNAKVKDIYMVYKLGASVEGNTAALSDTAIPMWNIKLEDGSIFEIRGFEIL